MNKANLKISQKSKSRTLPAQSKPKTLPAQSFPPEVRKDLDTLKMLLEQDNNRQWEIGDTITRLMDRHRMTQRQIAKAIGRHESTLSMLLAVARAFPPEQRVASVPFVAHRKAAYGTKKATETARKAGTPVEVKPITVLKEMQRMGIRDQRGATRIAQTVINRVRKPVRPDRLKIDGERCHHMPCEDAAKMVGDTTVKFINMDPPYGQYANTADGHPRMGSIIDSSKRTDCDNDTSDDAIRVTVAAIKAWAPKLEPNGCIGLWQACKELRLPILQQIHDSGLVVEMCVVWDKRSSQAGDGGTAWTYASEFCWILKRADGYLVNHSGSDRSNIVPMRQSNAIGHMYQKPDDLCSFFIEKHTHAGEVVVDCFGCSGAFCIEAERLGRSWHYIESNKANFDWGSARIMEAKVKMKKKSA
jgi:DNA modification methylase